MLLIPTSGDCWVIAEPDLRSTDWSALTGENWRKSGLERVAGIEPASQAWKASALPLSYTRISNGLTTSRTVGLQLGLQRAAADALPKCHDNSGVVNIGSADVFNVSCGPRNNPSDFLIARPAMLSRDYQP